MRKEPKVNTSTAGACIVSNNIIKEASQVNRIYISNRACIKICAMMLVGSPFALLELLSTTMLRLVHASLCLV